MKGKEAVLAGSLEFISLADLFQLLGGNSSTGILNLRSKHSPNQGNIYFINGDPVNASIGPQKGVKAIYSLFGWTTGNFEFYEEKVTVSPTIKQGRMEIVLDALRMLDDGEIKQVGPQIMDGAKATGKEGKGSSPLVKGPMIDYTYVIREESFKDGEELIKEGTHGKWMWIVFDGTVKVTRETDKGPIVISRLGQGCFIGTIKSLLFGEYTRNATITAEGDTRLCLLESDSLYHEYTALSQEFRRLLLSLDARLVKVTNMAVDLYSNKSSNAGILKNKKMLIKRGSSHTNIYSINEGKAYVVGQSKKGYVPLATLEKKDVIGELPFMDFGHEERSASVVVSEDFKAEKLDPKKLEAEYNALSSTFKNLIYNISICISMTTHLVYRYHGTKR